MAALDERPIVKFGGSLTNRSGGRAGLQAPSSKELMEKVPAWVDFIKSVAGWSRVEPGTLTLDDVKPLPGPALASVESLGIEPADLFQDYDPQYVEFLCRCRGKRHFYGAIAHAGGQSHAAAVSQQQTPARQDRLEVYSSERLRDILQLETGAIVEISVFNKSDWVQTTG